ncbi:MAG: type II toxin-antitoxin system RelB/DinJ family antitoxin [Candidatus Avilachnospira sp.]
MAQTTMSIRVDENDKKRFELFCNQTGMNVSVAVNMFIKAVLREDRLPFEVKADPFYSEKNMLALNESIREMSEGKTVTKTLKELESMEKD